MGQGQPRACFRGVVRYVNKVMDRLQKAKKKKEARTQVRTKDQQICNLLRYHCAIRAFLQAGGRRLNIFCAFYFSSKWPKFQNLMRFYCYSTLKQFGDKVLARQTLRIPSYPHYHQTRSHYQTSLANYYKSNHTSNVGSRTVHTSCTATCRAFTVKVCLPRPTYAPGCSAGL